MMDRGKEHVVPFLVCAFALVMATIAASWTGFFIALIALITGGVVGAYYMALQVRREVAKVTEEFEERPFPFL